MRIAVLGPLEVDEGQVQLAPRDQVVLEALAARPGESVRAEALAEALWGEHLPPSWSKVVQGCVSRLRKAMGPGPIVTSGTGYKLVLHRDEFDHLRFEDLLLRAHGLLSTGEPERARYVSGQALGLWRGDPLQRLGDWEAGRVESERLGELRRDAEDLYAESAIRAGRHGEVLGELHRMVAQQPTREQRWGLLALAQYRVGRQAEALATLQRARGTLVNDFGLDPGPRLVELEAAILQQDPSLAADDAPPAATPTCPYLGLVAYDIGDAPAYFGRETDTTASLRRLDETGVLAVVGPSGCGKSSLIRAGVAAALVRDGNRVHVVTPGEHPEEVLLRAPAGRGTVLVVDQCEEALALDETSPERDAFFAGLVALAAHGRLVVSLRADRLGELAAHPDFAHLVEKGLYLLGGMARTELRRAIEGPAAQAGLRLEPGLVDLLVREAEGSPGALPLLSHVLRQIWRHREGDTLTVQGYAATGGVREAVAQSAERLYRELSPAQQGMLHDLMVRLVAPDDTGEPMRTRVARRSVTSDAEHTAVVEALVGARLLSSDGDTVEIAHESLAVAWPRLRSWLDDDVDGLRIMRHLTVASESWDELGRPDSELYRGVRLAKAVQWRGTASPTLTTAEREFLEASERSADQERRNAEQQIRLERRTNRRLRTLLAGVAALLAAAILAGSVAVTAAKRADTEALAATRQAAAADARRMGALALASGEADTSLMLALAGVATQSTVDTRNNLLVEVDRLPGLITSTHGDVGAMSALSISSVDGRVAVSALADGVVLFDATTLRELGRNRLGGARTAEYSPDGSLLAVSADALMAPGAAGSNPPPVRLLDTQGRLAPSQLGDIPQGFLAVDRAGFSPDGRWLAVPLRMGDEQFQVAVWDLNAPESPAALVPTPTPVEYVGISKDGRTLFTKGDDLRSWDLPAGTLRRKVSFEALGVARSPEDFRLSPDGRTIAMPSDADVALLDAATLRVRHRAVTKGRAHKLSFSADGTRLAASDDGFVVWNVSGPEPVEEFRTDRWGTDVPALSPDGRTLYTAGGNHRLLAWDVDGSRRFLPVRPGPPRDEPDRRAWARVSDDGQAIAYWGAEKLQARDVATGMLGPLIRPGTRQGQAFDLAWSPDHQRLVGVYGDDLVQVWDPWTGRRIARTSIAPDAVGTAGFSKDGQLLLIGTLAGSIQVYDAATLMVVRSGISPGVGEISSLDASPDGHTMVVNGFDGVRIADFVSGRVLSTPPSSGIYSPDGRRIGVNRGDQVGLLDAKSLRWIARPSAAHPYAGVYAAFSRDGSIFATSDDTKVAVWNGRTGEFIGAMTAPDSAVGFLDPSTLVIAGADGSVRTWDLRVETWLAKACQMAGRGLTQEEWRTYLPDRAYRDPCRART